MTKTMVSLHEADQRETNGGSNRGSGQRKPEMDKHINSTTVSSNEGPCVTILHITQKLIKNNKIAVRGMLTYRDVVHGELGNVGNTGDVKVGGV